jgi:hypothetical protein
MIGYCDSVENRNQGSGQIFILKSNLLVSSVVFALRSLVLGADYYHLFFTIIVHVR